MVKRFLEWLWQRRTDRLVVLKVDFAVSADKAKDLEQMLQPLREKYGLDFVVLEPGMTLSRFDDI